MNEGYIFDIQRSAMHDGPGIRTTVFLQGCPLRCQWCHNPESMQQPPSAGRKTTTAQVMEIVRRDAPFYQMSGGGLTISGGEPTNQFEFCVSLLRAAQEEGIHTCLDTSGAFSPARLETLLPLVDLWLLDCKATDPPPEWLGINILPLEKVRADLLRSGARVRLRCPLLPGLNDTPCHLAAIAQLSHQVEGVDLMPYHKLGLHKRKEPSPLEGQREPTAEDIEAWQAQLRLLGAVNVGLG